MSRLIKKNNKNIFTSILNQKGSITTMWALALLAIVVLIISQMAIRSQYLNIQHSKQKRRDMAQEAIISLALKLRQSYTMAQLDSTCAQFSTPQGTLAPKQINGIDFCFEDLNNFCVSLETNTQTLISACASLSNEALNWESAGASTSIVATPNPDGEGTKNRINIPPPATSTLWRSCASPASCVRVALCPLGTSSCNLDQVLAYQTVRFGEL